MNTKWFAVSLMGMVTVCSFHRPALAVEVYGEAFSEGEIITVDVFADTMNEELRSCSVDVQYSPSEVVVIEAMKNEEDWYFHDGNMRVPYADPDVSMPGRVKILDAKLDANNPKAGVLGNAVPLGKVVFRRLMTEPPKFRISMPDDPNGTFATYVTTQNMVLDDQPGGVEFTEVWPDPNDEDLDGLGDQWEEDNFGDIANAYYNEDPDKDGLNNQAEEALGTGPLDETSTFKAKIVRESEDEVRIEWYSVTGRTYAVQFGSEMVNFNEVAHGLPATPPTNTFIHSVPPLERDMCYRLYLESP